MIKATSTIKMNLGRIRELTGAAVTALELTGEELHKEVANSQKVPMKTGALTGEQFFVDTSASNTGTVTLVHDMPYARRLYYHPEYNFSKKFHTDAQGEWLKDWLPGGSKGDFAPNTFKKLYKQIGGV